MGDLERQLRRYRLTAAEIVYRLPDHPSLLQSFTWQTCDIEPEFPVLRRFLAFWERAIEGRLHSVRVATVPVVGAAELCVVGHELMLQ